jgi:hypothetical protein
MRIRHRHVFRKSMLRTQVDKLFRARRFWNRAALYAGSVAILGGCTSIGTQYMSPPPTQPSATLVAQGGSVYINTHDEKGCYQGRTEIPGNSEFRLWPGKEAVLVYEIQGSPSRVAYPIDDSFCRAVFAFVPEEGARYAVHGTWTDSDRVLDGKLVLRTCGGAVSRITADGMQEAVEVKKLTLRQRGIACIQAAEG